MPKPNVRRLTSKKSASRATADADAAVWLDPRKLKPWKENPRANSGEPVARVMESIKRFGFSAPIVARAADMEIIAGHTRWLAACQLKLLRVPVRLLDVTAADAHTLALADNRYTELTSWLTTGLHKVLERLDLSDVRFAGWTDKEFQLMAPKSISFGESKEVDLDALAAEQFAHKCPQCGCQFNE